MNLFRRTLSESWRGLSGWTLGIIAAVLLYIPFYPSIGGTEIVEAMSRMFPPEFASLFGLDRMTDGAGYVQASYFGLTAYLLLAIAAIGWGTATLARPEEDGSLELTLAHGVTRWQVVLEGALALLVRLAVPVAAGSLLILALDSPAKLGLNFGNLWAATVALFLLTALTGLAALGAGAFTGRVSAATGTGAFVAVAAYVLDAVSGLAGEPWLADISPYHWAFGQDPLTTGFDWTGLGLLAAACVLMVIVGGFRFNRRDVGA